MNLVMCRACGEFVLARKKGRSLVSVDDACPSCDGVEFNDVHSDTVVRADDQ